MIKMTSAGVAAQAIVDAIVDCACEGIQGAEDHCEETWGDDWSKRAAALRVADLLAMKLRRKSKS